MIAYHLEAQRMVIFCEHLTLDSTCGAKQKTITLSINSLETFERTSPSEI